MISYKEALACLLLGMIIGLTIGYIEIHERNIKIDRLEKINQGIEARVVDTTVHTILDEPGYLFEFFNEAPKWEEIEAVPYSRCYRHIIDDNNSDYIMCKAI